MKYSKKFLSFILDIIIIFGVGILFTLPFYNLEKQIEHPCIEWEQKDEICENEITCIGIFAKKCKEKMVCYQPEKECIKR